MPNSLLDSFSMSVFLFAFGAMLIGVCIWAAIFQYAGKRKSFETSYGKIWLATLIPALGVAVVQVLFPSTDLMSLLSRIASAVVFALILNLSMKLVYKESFSSPAWIMFSLIYGAVELFFGFTNFFLY